MRRILGLVVAVGVGIVALPHARAQSVLPVEPCIAGANQNGVVGCWPVGPSNPLPTTGAGGTVSTTPSASAVTPTTVTCGTTSTAFGVTGTSYLSVWVPPADTANVCFGWGSNAATTSAPSQCFGPGTAVSWGGGTGACIVATGTQPIVVETK